MMTTTVVDCTSFHEGVTTLVISERTSRRKSRLRVNRLRARLGTPSSEWIAAALAIDFFFSVFSAVGIRLALISAAPGRDFR